MKTGHLTLKWGSIKSINFDGNTELEKVFNKWQKLGVSMSAIAHHDSKEQKELICQMIDLVKGKIFLEWDGKYVSKKEAKKYVMEYGN